MPLQENLLLCAGADVCASMLYKCNLKEAIEEAKDCVKAAVPQLWLSLGRIHTVIFREKKHCERNLMALVLAIKQRFHVRP